jgi:hypothetical protein
MILQHLASCNKSKLDKDPQIPSLKDFIKASVADTDPGSGAF